MSFQNQVQSGESSFKHVSTIHAIPPFPSHTAVVSVYHHRLGSAYKKAGLRSGQNLVCIIIALVVMSSPTVFIYLDLFFVLVFAASTTNSSNMHLLLVTPHPPPGTSKFCPSHRRDFRGFSRLKSHQTEKCIPIHAYVVALLKDTTGLILSLLPSLPTFRLCDALFSCSHLCDMRRRSGPTQGIGGSLKRAGTTLTRLKAAEVMDTVIMVASTLFFFATVCFVVYQRVPLLGLL